MRIDRVSSLLRLLHHDREGLDDSGVTLYDPVLQARELLLMRSSSLKNFLLVELHYESKYKERGVAVETRSTCRKKISSSREPVIEGFGRANARRMVPQRSCNER